jgi:hypothetical protein
MASATRLAASTISLAHFLHDRVEARLLEQPDGLDRLVHHVDRVIHRLDQILDIDPVERRDEAAAHGKQHFAGDIVRLVLERHDARAMGIGRPFRQAARQRFGSTDDSARVLLRTDRRTGLRVA